MQKPFAVQEALFISGDILEHPALQELNATESVLNWTALERLMSSIYDADRGRPSYPLLTLFRGLLLGLWYGLSDQQLAKFLARDLLFRKFCRLGFDGGTPDDGTLGRFRQKLVSHKVWEQLLGEVNHQLEKQHIIIKEGRINIVDATPVQAVQSSNRKDKTGKPSKDPEAGWHVKNNSQGRRTSTYGYSVHTAVDEDGFVQRQTVTPGHVHDSQELDTLLLGDEEQLYADSAYSSAQTRKKLKHLGIEDKVQRRGYRNTPLSANNTARNKVIAVTRSGGERPFASYKRVFALARTRVLGLANNMTFYGLAAIALNIQKGARFLQRYGLPKTQMTG